MKRNSGITLIGLLILVVVFSLIICGSVQVVRKMIAKAERIADARDERMEEQMRVDKMSTANDDYFIDTPGAVWTELTNGWWKVEIPDEEYFNAINNDYEEWAILWAPEVGGPWYDTGNRVEGNPQSMRQYLFDYCYAEAPWAEWGGHSDGRHQAFYKFVYPWDVPAPDNTPDK